MTLSITTLRICAECHDLFISMLNVNLLSVVMLSVIMLNVVMVSVVAPFKTFPKFENLKSTQ
jgi:hypothetical protein